MEISSRSQIASWLIGGCVPSATMTSKDFVTEAICWCSVLNIKPTGAVRVPSGITSSTRLPRYASAGQVLATVSVTADSLSAVLSAETTADAIDGAVIGNYSLEVVSKFKIRV